MANPSLISLATAITVAEESVAQASLALKASDSNDSQVGIVRRDFLLGSLFDGIVRDDADFISQISSEWQLKKVTACIDGVQNFIKGITVSYVSTTD